MSTAGDPLRAADEVAAALRSQLSDAGERVDLLIVFVSIDHGPRLPEVQAKLLAALSPRVALAVAADGIIGRGREVEEGSAVSAMALRLPGASFRPFTIDREAWGEIVETPEVLGEHIHMAGDAVRGVVLVADPYSTPMARALPITNDILPGVPIVGGMARPPQAGMSMLMVGDKLCREGSVGFAIGGRVRVDTTVSQGCRPIGKPMVITRSHRHVLQELGGRKALEVLSGLLETLNETDRAMVQSHGLWVGRVINEYKDHFGRGDFLIRPITGFDQQSGAFGLGDPHIRIGQTIQFHVRDAVSAREDFKLLLDAQALQGPATGAFLFSCNGRGHRLFNQPDTDPTMVRDALNDPPITGCFAAGEIGPVGGQTHLHGHTASLMVLRPEG